MKKFAGIGICPPLLVGITFDFTADHPKYCCQFPYQKTGDSPRVLVVPEFWWGTVPEFWWVGTVPEFWCQFVQPLALVGSPAGDLRCEPPRRKPRAIAISPVPIRLGYTIMVEPLSPMAPSDAHASASYGCLAVLFHWLRQL